MKDREEKRIAEDDGRTIADMSDVGPHSVLSGLFWFRHPPGEKSDHAGNGERSGERYDPASGSRDIPETPISPEERRMWIFGSIRAALLIGLVYIGVLGGAIALMVLFWKH